MGGYQTDTTTKHVGDDKQGADVTTTVTTNPDGSQTIETTTRGADGKEHRTTTTVAADHHDGAPSPADAGPVQQAEDKYKTSGDPGTVKHLGPGY